MLAYSSFLGKKKIHISRKNASIFCQFTIMLAIESIRKMSIKVCEEKPFFFSYRRLTSVRYKRYHMALGLKKIFDMHRYHATFPKGNSTFFP